MNTNSDIFADLEKVIEAAFQTETAHARTKRDQGIEHLRFLRENFGERIHVNGKPVEPSPAVSESVVDPLNGSGVSLKSAMIQAIDTLKEPITRGRVMLWVNDKYPKFAGSKEGTIASTFSRVKGEHLQPVEGNDRFVFKRKESAGSNGHSS